MNHPRKKKSVHLRTCLNCSGKFPTLRKKQYCSDRCEKLWEREMRAACQVGRGYLEAQG